MVSDGARVTVQALSSVKRNIFTTICSEAGVRGALIAIVTGLLVLFSVAVVIRAIAGLDRRLICVTRRESFVRAESLALARAMVVGDRARRPQPEFGRAVGTWAHPRIRDALLEDGSVYGDRLFT